MDAELVRQGARVATKHSKRHTAVAALGPLTALGGLIWAIAQPYRVTLLEPEKHSFWYLVVQPPLLVMLVGAVFHFWVVPSLLADLEEVEERR
jgi:hypothetical protein